MRLALEVDDENTRRKRGSVTVTMCVAFHQNTKIALEHKGQGQIAKSNHFFGSPSILLKLDGVALTVEYACSRSPCQHLVGL